MRKASCESSSRSLYSRRHRARRAPSIGWSSNAIWVSGVATTRCVPKRALLPELMDEVQHSEHAARVERIQKAHRDEVAHAAHMQKFREGAQREGKLAASVAFLDEETYMPFEKRKKEEEKKAAKEARHKELREKLWMGVGLVSRGIAWEVENDTRSELRSEIDNHSRVKGKVKEVTDTNLLRERISLRETRLVKDAVERFWQVLRNTENCMTMIDGGDGDSTVDDDIGVSLEGYMQLFIRINKCLSSKFDLGEATRIVEGDWRGDTVGEEGLRYMPFRQCMAELADMYAQTVDAASYAQWLRDCYDDCIDEDGLFRDLDHIKFDPPLAGVKVKAEREDRFRKHREKMEAEGKLRREEIAARAARQATWKAGDAHQTWKTQDNAGFASLQATDPASGAMPVDASDEQRRIAAARTMQARERGRQSRKEAERRRTVLASNTGLSDQRSGASRLNVVDENRRIAAAHRDEQRRIAAARAMQAGARGWQSRKEARRRRLAVLMIQASLRGYRIRTVAYSLRGLRRKMGGGVSMPGVRYAALPKRVDLARRQLGPVWDRLHARNTRQAADTMAKLLTPRTASRLRTSSRVRPRPPLPKDPLLAPLKGPLKRSQAAALPPQPQSLHSQSLPSLPVPLQPLNAKLLAKQQPLCPAPPHFTSSPHSWRVLARASTLYPSASVGQIETRQPSWHGAVPSTPALIARSLAASLGPQSSMRQSRSAEELQAPNAVARPRLSQPSSSPYLPRLSPLTIDPEASLPPRMSKPTMTKDPTYMSDESSDSDDDDDIQPKRLGW